MSSPDPYGRNDPCPCGSGTKYKRCCLHKNRAAGAGSDVPLSGRTAPDPVADIIAGVRAALEGREFESEAELKAVMSTLMDQQHSRPVDDFLGLRSADMHALLHTPFDEPDLVEIVSVLDVDPEAPAMALFDGIREAIGDKGLLATQTGNLPRALCRELFDAGLIPEAIDPYRSGFGAIRSEDDFPELSSLRATAEMAGLIQLRGRRFMATPLLRKARDSGGNRAVYPLLLQARAMEFNWGWGDRYEEVPIVQQAWLFLVFLLQRLVVTQTPGQVIERAFITAFPVALEELAGDTDDKRRGMLARIVNLRGLLRFAAFFGLVDATLVHPARSFNDAVMLKSTPLLHDAIRFGPLAPSG